MARMTRRLLLNLLVALSMLLFVAAAALWVRSYRVCDMAGATLGTRSLWATSKNGRVEVELLWWQTWEGFTWRRFAYPVAPPARPGGARPRSGAAAGQGAPWFQAYRATTGRGTPRYGVIFPHWAALLPATVVPAGWLVRHRNRQRRRGRGLCPGCGYDLRATPERCPECGAPATAGAASGGRE